MAGFQAVIDRGLVVSCQALADEPLHGANWMAAMAVAAAAGGASGIRANGPADIQAIRLAVRLPVIGLHKQRFPDSDIYITPTLATARSVAAAGAQVVALDATGRRRPGGESLSATIAALKEEFGVLVLADVATVAEGVAAVTSGADAVATTLAGYTEETSHLTGPHFALLQALVQSVPVPVLAEGGIWTPEEAALAVAAGAYAVVVGSAITRPQVITSRFRAAIDRQLSR